jgi:hypothetical protein
MSASTTLKFAWGLGSRMALKVVHGDEAIDRLNLGDQRREGFSQSAFHPGPDAVLDADRLRTQFVFVVPV